MRNLLVNWLPHVWLQKAAAIRKCLFLVLAPAALAVAGALMNYATPAADANPAQNRAKGGAPAQDVNVANPATAPVLAVNLNDPGRVPFQSIHPVITPLENHQFGVPFGTVPDGHRLVVQHVSGQVFFGDLPTPVTVLLTKLTADTQLRSIFPVPNSQAFDQPVLAYYDAGENPLVIITADPQLEIFEPTKFAGVTLTGYLVDCNIGPCAAIAQ